jgi:hypothetical protein
MLKRILPVALLALFFSVSAYAQIPEYNLSVYSDAYTPLTSGTLIDSGVVWNGNTQNFAAALPFPFHIGRSVCPAFISEGGSDVVTDTLNVGYSGFTLTDATLDDRGLVGDTVSRSPVRYMVSGATGHRIFKVEVANAGFDQEYLDSNTLNDSVNLQIWYYEDSNIVELRYGPSHITGTDYFALGGNIVAFADSLDDNSNGNAYVLSGNPMTPTIQLITLTNGIPNTLPTPLSSFPASGTVYRFTPTAFEDSLLGTGRNLTVSNNVKVYPTACTDKINVAYNSDVAATYHVYSITGADMQLSGDLTNGVTGINTSALPAGTYLVRVNNGASAKTFKFVKM